MAFKRSAVAKTEIIKVRVTALEKAELTHEAATRLLPLSEFVLRRIAGKQAPDRYDYRAISALGALSRQLKLLYREHPEPQNEAAFLALMERISVAIDRLWNTRGPA